MAGQKANKNRKYGRTSRSPAMSRYNAENRIEKNRILKLMRHLKKHPKDKKARTATEYVKFEPQRKRGLLS